MEFSHISLCNVLYKIFSKVLAYRLKRILPLLITEHQSAFTKNRLIFDNILVGFETIHSMENQNSGNEGLIALKLDISKVYDRVKWSFMEMMMRKLGFTERWIELMMVYVKTVTYFVLVNGVPNGMIIPTRGICQGDPLSHFLFFLCIEGLHAMISKVDKEGTIQSFSLYNRGLRLTHLLFANDDLLFCRATRNECLKILDILEQYEKVLEQQIN